MFRFWSSILIPHDFLLVWKRVKHQREGVALHCKEGKSRNGRDECGSCRLLHGVPSADFLEAKCTGLTLDKQADEVFGAGTNQQ